MFFSLFLCLIHSYSYQKPTDPFGDFRLGDEEGISFDIEEENEKVYLSTQKYIYFGLIEWKEGEREGSISELYNKSRIYSESFNITNTRNSGVTFVGFYWRLNNSQLNCKRAYSIVNKNSAEIFVNISKNEEEDSENDTFCYMFSLPTDKVEIEVKDTIEPVSVCHNGIEDFCEEIYDNLTLTNNSKKSISFVIAAKNGSSINIKGNNNILADFDSKLTQFFDTSNYTLSDDDPYPTNGDISYITIHGRVVWWVWTLLFGFVGIYAIIFIIAGCGAPKNNNDVPLYYWVTSEYLPMAALLTEKDIY